jgi:TonB family protein
MTIWRAGVVVLIVSLGGVGMVASAQEAPAAAPVLVDGAPVVKTWVQPVYPAELKDKNVQGSVDVALVIDETGALKSVRATKATDPRFEAAVLEAVSKWTFSPAVEGNEKVAMGCGFRWKFTLPYPPAGAQPPASLDIRPLSRKPAVSEVTPDPEYPESVLPKKLNGQVMFDVEIGADGAVSNAKVLYASYAEFVRPAVLAVRNWRFKPAMQGELPLRDKKRVPVTFEYDDSPATDKKTLLEASDFYVDLPEGLTERALFDQAPEVLALCDPVFPQEVLTSDQPGEAHVSFTVNLQGVPENIHVRFASSPACAMAVTASIEATIFRAAVLSGKAVPITLVKKCRFVAPPAVVGDKESDETRLLRMIKAGESVPAAKGLDAKLRPIWRAMPIYPAALKEEKIAGRAEVEFVIDRTGRARVPKILSATRDEMGWAAATAISQWLFEPPTRGGEPVDVRVRIPLDFNPGA